MAKKRGTTKEVKRLETADGRPGEKITTEARRTRRPEGEALGAGAVGQGDGDLGAERLSVATGLESTEAGGAKPEGNGTDETHGMHGTETGAGEDTGAPGVDGGLPGEGVFARKMEVWEIPLGRLSPGRNHRKHFDEGKMLELTESVKARGILEPIIVREIPEDRWIITPGINSCAGYWYVYDRRRFVGAISSRNPLENQYDGAAERFDSGEAARAWCPTHEIIMGERRYRAATAAGLATAPCIVKAADDAEALMDSVVENVVREEIGPIELGDAFRELLQLGVKEKDLAKRLGMHTSTISNAMRVAGSPEPVRELVSSGELTATHAKAILGVSKRPEVQIALAEAAVEGKIPSKDIETFDWNTQHALTGKGLACFIRPGSLVNVKETCKKEKCADLKRGKGADYVCLRPECFKEREEAAQKALLAERALKSPALAAKLEESGGTIRNKSDVPYDSYASLKNDTPPGCREDCEHRLPVLGYSDAVEDICMNPKCHRSLRSKDTRGQNADRRKVLAEKLERAQEMLDRGAEFERVLVIGLSDSFKQVSKTALKKAVDRLELEVDVEKLASYDRVVQCTELARFIGSKGSRCVDVLAEAWMVQECERANCPGATTPMLDMYIRWQTPIVEDKEPEGGYEIQTANDCGVYDCLNVNRLRIEPEGMQRAGAIELARGKKGWYWGRSLWGGAAFSPSKSRGPFETRNEAIEAAAGEMLATLAEGGFPDQAGVADSIRAWLKSRGLSEVSASPERADGANHGDTEDTEGDKRLETADGRPGGPESDGSDRSDGSDKSDADDPQPFQEEANPEDAGETTALAVEAVSEGRYVIEKFDEAGEPVRIVPCIFPDGDTARAEADRLAEKFDARYEVRPALPEESFPKFNTDEQDVQNAGSAESDGADRSDGSDASGERDPDGDVTDVTDGTHGTGRGEVPTGVVSDGREVTEAGGKVSGKAGKGRKRGKS